jgi:hypothetical protein
MYFSHVATDLEGAQRHHYVSDIVASTLIGRTIAAAVATFLV